jgi:peptide/histidine transporter 3/4
LTKLFIGCDKLVILFSCGAAIEFSERVSYFGIAANLISYLTKVMNEDLKTAAKNVNYWAGTTTLMPLIGGFLADAYTGRFPMVLISSLVYLMVNLFMSMSYTFYFRLKEIFYANVLHFLF